MYIYTTFETVRNHVKSLKTDRLNSFETGSGIIIITVVVIVITIIIIIYIYSNHNQLSNK